MIVRVVEAKPHEGDDFRRPTEDVQVDEQNISTRGDRVLGEVAQALEDQKNSTAKFLPVGIFQLQI